MDRRGTESVQSRGKAVYLWSSKCPGSPRPLWYKEALWSFLNRWGTQGSPTRAVPPGPPLANSLVVLNRGTRELKSNRLFASPIGLEFTSRPLPLQIWSISFAVSLGGGRHPCGFMDEAQRGQGMSPRSHSNTQNCKRFNPCLLLLKDDTGIVSSRNEMSPFRAHCYCPAKLEYAT